MVDETPAVEQTPVEEEEIQFPAAKYEEIDGKQRLIPGWKQLKNKNRQ